MTDTSKDKEPATFLGWGPGIISAGDTDWPVVDCAPEQPVMQADLIGEQTAWQRMIDQLKLTEDRIFKDGALSSQDWGTGSFYPNDTDWKAAWERCREHGEGLQKRLNKTIAERDALSARVVELEAELEDERDEFSRHQEKLSTEFEGECWAVLRSLIERVGYKWTSEDTSDGIQADRAHDIIRDAFSELEAAQPEMAAEVKPLVWEQISTCVWRAPTHFGYFAEVKSHRSVPDNFYVSSPVSDAEYARDVPCLSSAMDLAQADYDERIQSAITLTPKVDAIRDGMELAAKIASAMVPDDLCEVPAAIRKAMEDV